VFQISPALASASPTLPGRTPNNEQRAMNNELLTTDNWQLAAKCEIRDTRYEILIVMQNKPNFQEAQMNVNSFLAKAYENKSTFTVPPNKPNQTQSCRGAAPSEVASTCPCPNLTFPFLRKHQLFRARSEIRFTRYEIRNLPPCPQPKGPRPKHNCPPLALFPLTWRGAPDYNGSLRRMSCLQRSPIERV
jgi:hypothetical protein